MGKAAKQNVKDNKRNKNSKGEAPKKKKKRSCCCTCCITVLVIFLVIVAAGVGVGWYFGDKYSKQFFDMSLGEVFGVTNSLYWANDKKVVENAYGEDDLNVFYNELKEQLLLKDDVNFDLANIADSVNENQATAIASSAAKIFTSAVQAGSGVKTSEALADYDDNGEKVEGEVADSGEADGIKGMVNEIVDVLIDYIVDVYTRNNIDSDRLANYLKDDVALNELVFSLQDRSLCAFVNEVIGIAFDMASEKPQVAEVLEALQSYGIKDPLEIVKVKEMRFSKEVQTNAVGEHVEGATTVSLTLWFGIEDVARNAVRTMIPQFMPESLSWLRWIATPAGWLTDMVLPKNLYLTAEIGLTESTTPEIVINGMAGKNKENAYKLINGIANLAIEDIEDFDIQNMIKVSTDEPLTALREVAGLLEYDKEGEGKLIVDFYSTIIEMSGLNSEVENEEDKLTKRDLLEVINVVLSSDPDVQLEKLKKFSYENWYKTQSGSFINTTTPSATDVKIDYEKEFINELCRAFGLSVPEGMSNDEIIKALGINVSGGGNIDVNFLTSLIERDNIRALSNEDINNLGMHANDRMLGALMAPQITSLINGSESGLVFELQLQSLAIKTVGTHTHFQIALCVKSQELIDSLVSSGKLGEMSSYVSRLLGNLLPETLVITADVDITPNAETYDDTSIIFNDMSADAVFDVFSRLGMFDIDATLNEFLPSVREMISTLTQSIGVRFEGAVDDKNGALVLPDVFTFITKMVLVDDEGNLTVAPEELQVLLRGLYDTDSFDGLNPPDIDGEAALVAEIGDKYYIDVEGINTFAALTTHLQSSVADSNNFDMQTFNILPSQVGDLTIDDYKSTLAYDPRTVEQLVPVIDNDWLYSIINAQVGEDMKDKFEIVSIITAENEMKLTLRFSVAKIMGDTGALDTFEKVLPDMLYASADIHMTPVVSEDGSKTSYPVTFSVNALSESEFNTLTTLINSFDASFTFDTYSEMVGDNVYTGFTEIQDVMGEDGFIVTEKGIELQNIYAFIKNNTSLKDGTHTAAEVKAALQGLYERPEIEGNTVFANNFVSSDFLVNVYEGEVTPDYLRPKADLTEPSFPSFEITGTFKYTDMQLNAELNAIRSTTYEGALDSIQNVILSGADSSGHTHADKISKYKTWLEGYSVAPTDPDDAIMYTTLEFDINHMEGVPVNMQALVAGKLYATVAFSFEYDVSSSEIKVHYEGMRINSLTDEEKDTVFQMLNVTEEQLMNATDNDGNAVPVTQTFEQALKTVFANAQGIELGYKPNNHVDNGGKTIVDSSLEDFTGVPVDGIGIVTLPIKIGFGI